MKTESIDQLLQRIQDLESRLADAEDLIEAIKAGEVDAFAVGSENKPEVYTLQSGDYAYRVLIEKFGEGALNLTEDGLIVYTNSYFCELTDLNYENVIGSFIADLVDPDSRDLFQSLFKQAVSGSSKGEINLSVKGRLIPVYISMTSLQPKLATVSMIITDFTEKKKNEQVIMNYQRELEKNNLQLEERNQFVERLINSSLDLIMVVDINLRIMKVNRKAESIFKAYYPGNIVGKQIVEIDSWLSGEDVQQGIIKALNGEINVSNEMKDSLSGNYYEQNYIPLVNQRDEIYAVMVINHDITENKKQMEDLRKLSKSDKLKSDFIKMASHELNTPVTSIKGYIQLLLSMLRQKTEENPLSSELITTSLVKIDKQVLRLVRLISELLDLSRIEGGQLELRKEIFSLNDLVVEAIQDVKIINPAKKISLVQNMHCRIEADKDRISQVLSNLITNAIKYSPRSPKIDVSVNSIDKNKVGVSIRDYGIGISGEDHEKIFERFYRSEKENEETFPGFGIGLFISKEIVQRHGGSILVESEKGKGSTFTIVLSIYST